MLATSYEPSLAVTMSSCQQQDEGNVQKYQQITRHIKKAVNLECNNKEFFVYYAYSRRQLYLT